MARKLRAPIPFAFDPGFASGKLPSDEFSDSPNSRSLRPLLPDEMHVRSRARICAKPRNSGTKLNLPAPTKKKGAL
jgi:hypothetical protein